MLQLVHYAVKRCRATLYEKRKGMRFLVATFHGEARS